MIMRSFIFSIALSSAAFAQVGGPILGYVPEGARHSTHVRIAPPRAPSAASSITGRDFSHIAISPQQNFALATARYRRSDGR